jgi:hypothetical protein
MCRNYISLTLVSCIAVEGHLYFYYMYVTFVCNLCIYMCVRVYVCGMYARTSFPGIPTRLSCSALLTIPNFVFVRILAVLYKL